MLKNLWTAWGFLEHWYLCMTHNTWLSMFYVPSADKSKIMWAESFKKIGIVCSHTQGYDQGCCLYLVAVIFRFLVSCVAWIVVNQNQCQSNRDQISV
jgi:hypothetical protein